MKTFCILYVLHTVFFHYSKLEKESIFKEIIRKRKYIYLFIEKKATCNWTHTVQTRVVQGSAVLGE